MSSLSRLIWSEWIPAFFNLYDKSWPNKWINSGEIDTFRKISCGIGIRFFNLYDKSPETPWELRVDWGSRVPCVCGFPTVRLMLITQLCTCRGRYEFQKFCFGKPPWKASSFNPSNVHVFKTKTRETLWKGHSSWRAEFHHRSLRRSKFENNTTVRDTRWLVIRRKSEHVW